MGACKIQAKDLVRTRRYAPSSRVLTEKGAWIDDVLDNQIHTKILLHANPAPSHFPPHPNRPLQRANDAEHERRHLPPRKHEPVYESASTAADSNGV